MAQWLVLEGFEGVYEGSQWRFRSGEVIDDAVNPVAFLRDHGLSVSEYSDGMDPAITAFNQQHTNNPYPPSMLPSLSSQGRAVLTPEGGLAVRMINKTGAVSVKGMLVESGAGDLEFIANDIGGNHPIGVVYDSGVVDGGECLVVVSGVAQVLLENATGSTAGYWARTSTSASGRADITNAAPPGGGIPELDTHMNEIGHCLETVSAGTNKLSLIVMHFN